MNKLKYILLPLFSLLIFSACEDDSADNPMFGATDVPGIYNNVNWADGVTVKAGNKLTVTSQTSPADGATYKWTIDGVEVSKDKDIDLVMNNHGLFDLRYEVTRNGVVNSRSTQLIVYKDYVPKTYTKKSVAYLTLKGGIRDVPWNDITHLIVSSDSIKGTGTASEIGLPYYLPMEKAINLETLIITAHSFGVAVLLEYSGIISDYVNAAPLYASYTFYSAAVDPLKRPGLIANMIDYVKTNKFDGINVYMDKAADGAYLDPASLKTFYEDLAAAVPEKTETGYDFYLTMSVVGGWTNSSLMGVVNIPRYNWINVLAFAAEDLVPGPQSAVTYFTGQIEQWINWYGVAPARIVGMAPAFGLRYFGNTSEYTWGNLWQYTQYIPYATLCQTYPDAPTKNVINVDNGIYYDGLPAIEAKAQYVVTKNLGGMGIWSIENDSKDPLKSLTKKMNTTLGN